MNDQWDTRSLKQLAEVRVSGVDKKSRLGESEVRLCNYTDVYATLYLRDDLEYMVASATRAEIERFGLSVGDVVITKDSESPDDIGVPAVVADDVPGLVCAYHLALLRPRRDADVDPLFLALQLQTARVRKRLAVEASGTTRFGLSVAAMEDLDLRLPARPIQERISRVMQAFDAEVAASERLVVKFEAIRRGLMQELLSRGVAPNGQLRPVGDRAGRTKTTIGEQFRTRVERGREGLPIMSVVMSHGLVPRESVERRVQSALPASRHALVRKGDLTYNTMRMWQGVLGRADFDCLVSPAYVVLEPERTIDSRFAEWLFRDPETVRKFRRASRGVVDDRLRLHPVDLFPIDIEIPSSLDEQAAIADRLDAAQEQLVQERAHVAKLRRMRPGLLEDLFSETANVDALRE
jgi:type I restriction enzyme S subunit